MFKDSGINQKPWTYFTGQIKQYQTVKLTKTSGFVMKMKTDETPYSSDTCSYFSPLLQPEGGTATITMFS
jgi:hypothetical protein